MFTLRGAGHHVLLALLPPGPSIPHARTTSTSLLVRSVPVHPYSLTASSSLTSVAWPLVPVAVQSDCLLVRRKVEVRREGAPGPASQEPLDPSKPSLCDTMLERAWEIRGEKMSERVAMPITHQGHTYNGRRITGSQFTQATSR